MKLFGDAAQTSGLIAPGVLLTLIILSSNSVPDPLNGTKAAMKAEMRRVLSVPGVGPGPGRMPIEMFQFGSLVSPALCAGGDCGPLVAKPTTAES